MSPWGWWADATRKINEARRLIAESLDCRMDVFPEDDDLMAVADAVQDDDPCDDPNRHALTGCQSCVEAVVLVCGFAFNRSLALLLAEEGQR